MEIETGFADPDDFGMLRQSDQLLCEELVVICRFVRVHANRTPDPVIGLRDRAYPRELVEPCTDRQHGFDPRRPSTADHGITFCREIRKVEMAVAVDQL